jgi:small-conductance mechanosensitive channel
MRAFREYLFCLVPTLAMTLAAAQQPPPPAVPVQVNGQTCFVLHAGVGTFTPQQRAALVNQHLQQILRSPDRGDQTSIQDSDVGLLISVDGRPVVSVTAADARAENTETRALAERWAQSIRGALEQARGRSWHQTVRRLVITLLVLVVALLAVILLTRARTKLARSLEQRRERIPSLRLRGLELLSAETLFRTTSRLLLLFYSLVVLLIALAALLLVFGQFPATQGYAWQVAKWIWDPLVRIFWGVVGYLPNLFFILVIIAVTRLVVRVVDYIFTQADRGVISLEPWLHRDVARPTSQIVKAILIVLALFFIAPLVPGTGSTAAKGLSVIIGLMVSFGSSSTVGNLIAGVVLTYMRPYGLGDRVKISETLGDVVERRFLYTKVLTVKNEEVIVPSLQALSQPMINYSARARWPGLILHTTVTIGYDAPWRRVHELLLAAAQRTPHILQEPKPFVLQTALNDFFVSYQLNTYTNSPNKMQDIYSALHQNIQDAFNEGGVEIMSPHYYQLRDGNTTTLPPENRPEDYKPRRFQVETHPLDPRLRAPAAASPEGR